MLPLQPSPVRKRFPMTIRSTVTLLTASVVLLSAYSTVRPDLITLPHGMLPILFGTCLAALISIDSGDRGIATREFRSQPLNVRRSSRLIYLWLYLLVGADELTAWWSNYPIDAAVHKLGGFLIAGIVVLILIRIPAAVRPIRRHNVTMRPTTTSRAQG